MDMERLEQKLDAIVSSVASIDKNLAIHTQAFSDHVKSDEAIHGRIAPLETHVDRVTGAFKLLGLACLIGGTVAGIVAAFKS